MSKKLQDILPYIFPLIAIILVVIMFARWYKGKTTEAPTSTINDQMSVESLPVDMQNSIIKGASDYSMIDMQGAGQNSGEVRYQVSNDKLTFTVSALLPESKEDYAVWLVDPSSEAKKRVFNLTYSKAGYIGSAAVSASVLPVRVVVTKASDLMLDDVLLSAEIE